MKICEKCNNPIAYGVQSYNFDEYGFPTLRNGTDIALCYDCWDNEMNGPNSVK